MEEASEQCSFDSKDLNHCRGSFPALAAGVSFGGGQVIPGNLAHNRVNRRVLQKLLSYPSFVCISKFANGRFAAWFPKLYKYYHETLGALYEQDEGLKCLFLDSVWAAISFNFGPATWCYRHMDWGNLAFGVCIITNVGKFDSTCGSHLILWECGIVIEFPPGMSIIIPSAVISHSNLPIHQPHEIRYSFTQYTASGLFRWVEHGFQKEESYANGSLVAEHAAEEVRRAAHKDFGLSLFSTMDELHAMAQQS
ncbi:hypothetical protein L208DRAFT_1311947 [Tricholoma matsutake]|nr:hypothetical protein L208DRAFT_1311947 [Tricholoma matsutake 945]